MIKPLKTTGLTVLLLFFYSTAGQMDESKVTYNSFSVGTALPIGTTAAPTIPATNLKKLHNGWDANWTFFGKPFIDWGLPNLAFGGKISYSRWERDSTNTPVTFLGLQGLTRYYLPRLIGPIDLFGQAGCGWFLGEYSFTDPDTVDWTKPDFTPVVHEGQHCIGFHFGVGANADILEVMSSVTIVSMRRKLSKTQTIQKLSTWLSLNVGMTF